MASSGTVIIDHQPGQTGHGRHCENQEPVVGGELDDAVDHVVPRSDPSRDRQEL